MRKIATCTLLAALLLIPACQPQKPPPPKSYNGSVKVTRTNGEVTQIDVTLPGQSVSVNSREEANQLLAHLESLTAEIKAGRDQFKVQEKVQEPPPPATPGK